MTTSPGLGWPIPDGLAPIESDSQSPLGWHVPRETSVEEIDKELP